MDEIISFLDKWQTLTGAIIGGIFALSVALLVAYRLRRQDDLAAAMLLVGNLTTITTAGNLLVKLAEESKIDDENLPYWYSEKLVWKRIKLSPLFESSRIRIMPMNIYLAAHLELFQMYFTDIDVKLDMLSNDVKKFDSSKKTERNSKVLQAEAKIIHAGFIEAVVQAKCAERILIQRVLSNYPTFNAIRMLFFKKKEEKACMEMLIRKNNA